MRIRKGKEPVVGQKPSRRKGKRLVLLLGVLLLVVGAASYLQFGTSDAAQVKPGAVVKLDPIYLNLSDGHYLKLGLALQQTAAVSADVDGSKALDTAIELFSRTSMAQLGTATERDSVKRELIAQITHAYDGQVMTVYYTEFVMQ